MFLNASGFATLSHSQLEPRASGYRVWCIAAQVGEPVRVVTVVLPAEPVSNAVLVLARPRCGAAAPIRIGSARARLDGWLTRPRHEPGWALLDSLQIPRPPSGNKTSAFLSIQRHCQCEDCSLTRSLRVLCTVSATDQFLHFVCPHQGQGQPIVSRTYLSATAQAEPGLPRAPQGASARSLSPFFVWEDPGDSFAHIASNR
jgi:hypothetical protein